MKVPLDENVPHALRHHLVGHEAYTAAYARFAGLKNGGLLEATASAGFDVLVTGERTLQYKQNLAKRNIAIVSLSAVTWPPHLAKIVAAVDAAQPGSFTRVTCGSFVRRVLSASLRGASNHRKSLTVRGRERTMPRRRCGDTRERVIWRSLATHDFTNFTTVDAWPGPIPTMWSAAGSARPNAVRGTSCRAQMLEAMAAKCTFPLTVR